MADNETSLILADPTLRARFWTKVEKRGPDECWNWTGATRAGRYGSIRVGGKHGPMIAAHRIQMVWAGHDLTGRVVLHRCDNGMCVNPAHLRIGTQLDNIEDMNRKGRGVVPKGPDNGNAVLTEDDVRRIRRRLAKGEGPAKVARALGFHHLTVYKVAAGISYQNVACDIEHPRPSRRGVQNSQAKLTPDEIAELRRLYAAHQSFAEVARITGWTATLVRRVVTGERYADEQEVPPIKERTGPRRQLARRSLTDEQAAKIKRDAMAGNLTAQEIAARYGISDALVYAIKHGRAYAWIGDP